ncbi:prepilin peptidase [Vibrio paucivorans]
MEYIVWLGIIIIAVSDARENRIPNAALLFVLIASLIDKSISAQPLTLIGWSTVALVVMFFSAFILYLLGVMAPGDVKLMGVVGFIVGWGSLLQTTFWIAIASVVVGSLFAAMRLADEPSSGRALLTKYTMIFSYGSLAGKSFSPTVNNKNSKLRMPFAPVVVIGLAMQQYF